MIRIIYICGTRQQKEEATEAWQYPEGVSRRWPPPMGVDGCVVKMATSISSDLNWSYFLTSSLTVDICSTSKKGMFCRFVPSIAAYNTPFGSPHKTIYCSSVKYPFSLQDLTKSTLSYLFSISAITLQSLWHQLLVMLYPLFFKELLLFFLYSTL